MKNSILDATGTYVPWVKDSVTSKEAAGSMKPFAGTIRDRVFEYLKTVEATAEEVEIALGLSGNTVRPRLRELAMKNQIEHCGIRETKSGRRAWVWRACRCHDSR